MASSYWVSKSVITTALISSLAACGGGGGSAPEPSALSCTAPQVPNSAGTACVTPTSPSTNSAPQITSADSFSLSENTAKDSSVYTAVATDDDGDTITWSLVDDNSIFSINADNGAVTVTDTSKLIAANLANYKIQITASDGKASTTQVVTVNVTTDGTAKPSIVPSSSQAVIYYQRADQDYDGWILHAWNNESCNGYADFDDPGRSNTGTEWTVGLSSTGTDSNYGIYWLVDTKAAGACINYIVHKGNDKDPNDNDQKVVFEASRSAFVVSGVGVFDDHTKVTTQAPFKIADSAAHWIDNQTLVWNKNESDVRLVHSADGTLDEDFSVTAANAFELSTTTLTASQKALVPHLANWHAYQLAATDEQKKSLLKSQLVLAAFTGDEPTTASYVQTAKALDDIYTSGTNDADEEILGIQYAAPYVKVATWAPTAKRVDLNVFDADKRIVATHALVENTDSGVWAYTGQKADLDQKYYQFEVLVYHPVTKQIERLSATDPYSVNTSTDGRHSQFVDLNDDSTKPAGWDGHPVPTVAKVEDSVLLEAHIRDVSANDETTSVNNRGKYLAFTEANSNAMQYLQRLTEAGVNHFHMLPVNDLASIKEQGTFNLDNTVGQACALVSTLSICTTEDSNSTIRSVFKGLNPSTTQAAKLMDEIRGHDSFNWGYDPHHFNVVEGSYASSPEGIARIVEFRTMIKALHEKGLRVVLDVVYNHTSTSGVLANSVFDKLVPGYYHRYNEVSGDIERSTCCENTATEHKMMGKFVVDSLVHWTKHYGFDGYRFDVMGHMPKQVILDGRDAVAAIDSDTYFYGEGWNWGEVANNRLFEQATQANMAGTNVGTFNDRPRDTIRAAKLSQATVSLADVDHVRLGLAGTLQNYVLENQNGVKTLGKNFSQSAYGLAPADIINYVSKHDNETLWDALQFGINTSAGVEQRVRLHNLSAAIPVLSQGLPFFQLGVDKMRSKSMHRNTYDFGDWYNAIDYTNTSNNWNVGLPTPSEYGYNYAGQQVDAGHGEGWKWPLIGNLANNSNIPVTGVNIDFSEAVFAEFLKIRAGSPLFRLDSAQAVIDRVGFHNTGINQTPGLIVMSINDGSGLADLDPNSDAIVVIINGSNTSQSYRIKTASGFVLHPVQSSGADAVVQSASFSQGSTHGTFVVPAHTVAVFTKPQSGGQGPGLVVDPESVDSPYGDTPIYVSALGDGDDTLLEYDGRGLYSAQVSAQAGTYQFSVGDESFSTINLSFDDITVGSKSLAFTSGTNKTFSIVLQQSGTYQWSLKVGGAKPELSLELVSASVACQAPVSAGSAPFDISGGGSLFVRGNHSGWGADDKYKMTYIGNNQYKAVADFNGSFEFKLASDDNNWDTQLWAQNSDGSIKTADLALGQSHDVAYGNAGTGNNSMTLSQGTYSFTLTLNEANPAKETKPAGKLLVEQCN